LLASFVTIAEGWFWLFCFGFLLASLVVHLSIALFHPASSSAEYIIANPSPSIHVGTAILHIVEVGRGKAD
jgi:hypothetical protein